MSKLSEYLLSKYYKSEEHPYRLFKNAVFKTLAPEAVLLDAGCGRTMPVLKEYIGKANRLIGVELVDFTESVEGIESINSDLAHIPLPDASVDIVMSRSVFEHLVDPDSVYREMYRLLKPGGRLIFLTANLWDYATIIAKIVPNRFHGRIVAKVEGRAEEDVFPTAYKTNSRSAVLKLAKTSGFSVGRIDYLSQYPGYFMFNGVLFFIAMCYEKIISRIGFLEVLRGWLLVELVKPK
jgi:SAM-dependent methyltransferase